MIKTKEQWNTHFKNLKLLINKPKENLNHIVDLSIELHAFTHETINGNIQKSLEDQFWDMDGKVTSFSKSKLYSAAWHLWHSARIEDISCAYFFLDEKEIFDSSNFGNRLKFHLDIPVIV